MKFLLRLVLTIVITMAVWSFILPPQFKIGALTYFGDWATYLSECKTFEEKKALIMPVLIGKGLISKDFAEMKIEDVPNDVVWRAIKNNNAAFQHTTIEEFYKFIDQYNRSS